MKINYKNSKDFYNTTGFYCFLITTVFSLLWACYLLIFKNTIDLNEYEKQTQTQDSSNQKKQASQDQDESLAPKEPVKAWISTESLIAKGKKVYAINCAVCHGPKGLGDGTPGLSPPPRNLVEGKWKSGGSSKALYMTLQKGIEGTSMISFKHLAPLDRWALVHYMRSITNNKVPDDSKELEKFAPQAI